MPTLKLLPPFKNNLTCSKLVYMCVTFSFLCTFMYTNDMVVKRNEPLNWCKLVAGLDIADGFMLRFGTTLQYLL